MDRSTRMPRLLVFFAVTLAVVLCYTVAPPAQVKPEVALKAAIDREVVDGDLKTAIEMYRRLTQSADRVVAAKALLRMAQCYEKLGDTESRKAYERLVRDFADQKEVADQARARLAAIGARRAASSGGPSSHRLWTATENASIEQVSPDGRVVAYTKWNDSGMSADIVLHDLTSGTDRLVTNSAQEKGETAENGVFSKDGTQLAYTWYIGSGANLRSEVRVIALAGTGIPEPRRLMGDRQDVKYVWPFDWSADGKWIAVVISRKDFTRQVAVVATSDGTVRVLRTSVPEGFGGMALSPDGKYLALDTYAGQTLLHDIVILTTDAGREVPGIVHPADDALVGWSPDGTRLLFTSDRSGENDLWAQRFEGGALQGRPELLKANVGRFRSLGIGVSGAIYSRVENARPATEVKTAAFDFINGQWLSAPVDTRQFASEANMKPAMVPSPDWSPDGKFFAYTLDRDRRASTLSFNPAIVVRSIETNEVRELRPKLDSLVGMRLWAPDGKAFIAGGRSFEGRWGIWRIDATTGETTQLALGASGGNTLTNLIDVSPNGRIYYATTGGLMETDLATGKETRLLAGDAFKLIGWSSDGTKLYHVQLGPTADRKAVAVDASLIERDVASGQERKIYRGRIVQTPTRLSPDGRFIVTVVADTGTASASVLLVPVSGGEPRKLMTAPVRAATPGDTTSQKRPLAVLWFGWAPDSQSMFIKKNSQTDGPSEIWWVPVDGRSPKRVDIGSSGELMYVRVHPDGRRIAFPVMSGEPFRPSDVWVFENLLPKPVPPRTR